jgi:NAD dependent epimerase/dehydratase family
VGHLKPVDLCDRTGLSQNFGPKHMQRQSGSSVWRGNGTNHFVSISTRHVNNSKFFLKAYTILLSQCHNPEIWRKTTFPSPVFDNCTSQTRERIENTQRTIAMSRTLIIEFIHPFGYPSSFHIVDNRNLPMPDQKRILVTGGCGFVGSHLVDRLMLMGHQVICLDNFQTGHKVNVAHWCGIL